jgi:DNA polymerase-1
MTEKLCVLVDGSSYLYRAYHAMPNLTNSTGEPTGAIYGVVNMLKSLVKSYPEGTLITVVFDPKGKTVRHSIFPEYKANRSAMPEDLVPQIAPIHDIIRAMGLPVLVIPEQEADDVIGTLTKLAVASNYDVVISTGDKDMAQLVAPSVELVNTMTNVKLDRSGVKEKFGVFPEQIIDYLALIGDSSDNIPGVPKVGPKTASKWLNEYENISNLVDNIDSLSGKVAQNLQDNLEHLALAQKLVTIDTNVDIGVFTLESMQRLEVDTESLAEYYRKFGFKKYLQELGATKVNVKKNNADYKVILSKNEFNELLDHLDKAPVISVDTETNSLDSMIAELVGISVSFKSGSGFYIPLAHDYDEAPKQLEVKSVLSSLEPYLTRDDKIIVGQNIKYDYQVLVRHGLTLGGKWFDTMLLSYVLDSSSGRHNLNALAERYLDAELIEFEDVVGKGKDQVTFNKVDLEKATQYAAEDADIAFRLYEHLWPLLQQQGLSDIYLRFEQPLVKILADMEMTGVLLDISILREQGRRLSLMIHDLEQEVQILAGEEFNLASTKQLRKILFEKLELPVLKKTPNKQPATSEEVLKTLAVEHEIAAKLLDYRSLTKLQSTYVEKLPLQINAKTGRVHCSYNQAVTVTGRLSSTDPNLQNIPIKNEEGRRIRKAFISPPGKVLMAADYSQIELRIMAHLSKDQTLLNAFSTGQDIHTATAAEVFDIELSEVNDSHRRKAKAINFGLIYGMSAFGLAKQLEVSRGAAQEYIDRYFSRYPGVKQYMDSATLMVKDNGYVETIFGRRLYLPGISDKNPMVRKAAERAAINAPMQGTAADIIKIAMQQISRVILEKKYGARMLLQVHDELVFEVVEGEVDSFQKEVISAMATAATLNVPLEVSIDTGLNWDQAH